VSAYEKLVSDVEVEIKNARQGYEKAQAVRILGGIFRILETVTPEMRSVLDQEDLNPEDWLAMLRASPLAPP